VARWGRNAHHNSAAVAAGKREYAKRVADFKTASERLGYGDLTRYYWYHTIDLGNGLVTPGTYDYRPLLSMYGFPADMHGMSVLDVGSATGFFAFEFEKRGGTVVSVELPSIMCWDMPHGEKDRTVSELMRSADVRTVEELDHVHAEGPFQFCRKLLGSQVSRCLSSVYDLTPEKLGRESFDLIFVGDVLLHTFSPLAALVALAPLCHGLLVIAQQLATVNDNEPVMLYAGGPTMSRDHRTWWHPNKVCLEQLLDRVGFRDVELVCQMPSYPGQGGEWFVHNHAIIHARKDSRDRLTSRS
jgi:tRNA (mo5U34)-methyltransferase